MKFFIEKLDAFKELPEAEEREERELCLKKIYKANQKYIDRLKDD